MKLVHTSLEEPISFICWTFWSSHHSDGTDDRETSTNYFEIIVGQAALTLLSVL